LRISNHSLADPGAGVAGRLAAVIDLGVDDDTPADDGIVGAVEGYIIDGDGVAGMITGVTHLGAGQRMIMSLRVVVTPGALAVVEPQIAELVDVDGVIAGCEPADGRLDIDTICTLGEGDRSGSFVAGGRGHHCDRHLAYLCGDHLHLGGRLFESLLRLQLCLLADCGV